ncbi:MAG: hypothetical protein Q8930_12725 [Bacillota bacterium]|nr:hypothetical protein [Bacillota bacterium]
MFFRYPSYYTSLMAEDDISTLEDRYRIENEADEPWNYENIQFARVDAEYVQEATKAVEV